VIPVLIGFIAIRYFFLSGAVAIVGMIIFASCALAVETYGVMRYVARVFEKAEPLAV